MRHDTSTKQALIDFVKMVAYLIAIAFLAIVFLYLGWRYGGLGMTKEAHFQKLYKACLVKEEFTQEQCFTLAINQAYDGQPLVEIER